MNKYKLIVAAAMCFVFLPYQTPANYKESNIDPWQALPAILSQIKAPQFPNKDFLITAYGAVGDSVTSNTTAIKKAIEDCNKQGGGRVVVPKGTWLSGPIYLKSNVNLHLVKGAKIIFSTNPDDYLPVVHTRWEGVELMNYSPLIYSFKEKNIAITGEGILDGQASTDNWWAWKGGKGWVKGTPRREDPDKRPALFKMAEDEVPVKDRKFGKGFYLRPQFVQPYQCENVLIEGVTVKDSPMWNLNPVLCTNVTIQNVTIIGHGPNTDGCDPESCKNVLIKNCFFSTGDDCIAIKSGRNKDGRKLNVPSENIVIQNCTMANGHGGVVIGSEISGGVRNVFAENCKMNSPELDRVLRIKTSAERGGITENIFLRNIEVGQVRKETMIATMHYKEEKGNFIPVIRNVEIRNMTVKSGGEIGVRLEGYESSPVQDIRLINVTIDGVKQPTLTSHIKGISFDNVTINGKKAVL